MSNAIVINRNDTVYWLTNSRSRSLIPDEIGDLSEIVQRCDAVPPDLQAEVEAFSMLLDVFLTFYEERL